VGDGERARECKGERQGGWEAAGVRTFAGPVRTVDDFGEKGDRTRAGTACGETEPSTGITRKGYLRSENGESGFAHKKILEARHSVSHGGVKHESRESLGTQ
jgi:hypothetical protein